MARLANTYIWCEANTWLGWLTHIWYEAYAWLGWLTHMV